MTTPSWFDNRMSIGNLITIGTVLVAIIGGWFQFANRISVLERDLKRTEAVVERMQQERTELATRVIRIEEKISNQSDTLQRILRNTEQRDWRQGVQ